MRTRTSEPRRPLESITRPNELAHDSSTPSFRSALIAARVKFTEHADRVHIERWLSSADDPVWENIVTEIVRHSKHERPEELIADHYMGIVYMGLFGRGFAELAARIGEAPLYARQRDVKAHYSKLAETAEYLAKEFAFYDATATPQIAYLLEKEAVNFREAAAHIHPERVTYVSRQAGGKKRPRFRVYAAFMSKVIRAMRKKTGKPPYRAAVIMTNVAFPGADVTEEDAQSVWKAMAGKRRTRRPVHSATD
jgi:hypothetical protein